MLSAINNDTLLVIILVISAIILLSNFTILSNLRKKQEGKGAEHPSVLIHGENKDKNADGVGQEVVAAITAAITLTLDKEAEASGKPRAGFIVKSIKKL